MKSIHGTLYFIFRMEANRQGIVEKNHRIPSLQVGWKWLLERRRFENKNQQAYCPSRQEVLVKNVLPVNVPYRTGALERESISGSLSLCV